jgi:tungstate transport system substrate-binding protein
MFEKDCGIPIKKVTLCTGDADNLSRSNTKEQIDVVIGHEKEIEDKLVADGLFTNLREVLYSNFVLVGPKEDPAGVMGLKDPLEALKKIQKKKALFFSRGDNSGTHGLEKRMWKLAKIDPKGDWYITTKAGTDATLAIANRKRGYTIAHYVTFIQQHEPIDLKCCEQAGHGLRGNGLQPAKISKRPLRGRNDFHRLPDFSENPAIHRRLRNEKIRAPNGFSTGGAGKPQA